MKTALVPLLVYWLQMAAALASDLALLPELEVGAITTELTEGKPQLVDNAGKGIVPLGESEIVRDSITNQAKTILVMHLFFTEDLQGGGVGFTYSRLVVFVRAKDHIVRARNALVYTDPFMKDGAKRIVKLLSVAPNGSSVVAEVGILVNGEYKYLQKTIQLSPPAFLE